MTGGDLDDRSRATEAALLSGETADSCVREDVEHWAAVYEELTRFLLLSHPPHETLERYRRRLRYWRWRLDELARHTAPNGR